MDRGAKRKSGGAAVSPASARTPKRGRENDDISNLAETPESTREAGLRFVSQLRFAKDKTGNLIATDFLTLPDITEIPTYYDVIKLPIAIDTLEDKLEQHGYNNLAEFESDVKRMVNNAKQFNDSKSEIYANAERVRKLTSNWMVKNNPAYKDKTYQAIATPIPGGETVSLLPKPNQKVKREAEDNSPAPQAKRVKLNSQEPHRSVTATATPEVPNGASAGDVDQDTSGYSGKSFQQAQEQIVQELIQYKDEESDLAIFEPFVNLPSRKLTDYYQIIKQPTSLNSVLKKVRGFRSRNDVTGVTDLKSWAAFEEEVSRIWNNAREYNEDESEMFKLAGEFEEYFKGQLAEAKRYVHEPPQPSLRLNLAKKEPMKIRLSSKQNVAEPVATTSTSPGLSSGAAGVTVDQGALQRQKDAVNASVNGNGPSKSSQPASSEHFRPSTAGSATQILTNGVKTDGNRQSPAVNSVKAESSHSDPTRPSPHPVMSSNGPPVVPVAAVAPQTQPQPQPQQQQAPLYDMDSYFRRPGTDESDAVIQSLKITTHPDLGHANPKTKVIEPEFEVSWSSHILNLHASFTMLRLEPTLHHELTGPHLTPPVPARPYKFFVTVNGSRIAPTPILPPYVSAQTGTGTGTGTVTGAGAGTGAGTATGNATGAATGATPTVPGVKPGPNLRYDVRLAPGVNTIDVECATICVTSELLPNGMAAGKNVGPGALQTNPNAREILEREKITIHANLMTNRDWWWKYEKN